MSPTRPFLSDEIALQPVPDPTLCCSGQDKVSHQESAGRPTASTRRSSSWVFRSRPAAFCHLARLTTRLREAGRRGILRRHQQSLPSLSYEAEANRAHPLHHRNSNCDVLIGNTSTAASLPDRPVQSSTFTVFPRSRFFFATGARSTTPKFATSMAKME